MPRKTAGRIVAKKSAKQIAAATKNIMAWERKQAFRDNWFILAVGALLGFALGLLV